MNVTAKAPAKINLYLDILGKYENDYHRVEMIMQAVSLYDTVTISTNKSRQINISSNYKFPGVKQKNSAYRAVDEFFKYTKTVNPGLDVYINKKIPVSAGLAGGSSDAAAVLLALDHMFNTSLVNHDLAEIGQNIGADVPFCVHGGTMLSTGTGTELQPLPHIPHCYIVLCKPNIFISTKKAYTLSDKFKIFPKSVELTCQAINSQSLLKIANNLYNQFEIVLNLSEVYNIKNIMLQNGAMASCMSGSGPTVFGIFNKPALAKKCVNELFKNHKFVFLCNPIPHGVFICKNLNK